MSDDDFDSVDDARAELTGATVARTNDGTRYDVTVTEADRVTLTTADDDVTMSPNELLGAFKRGRYYRPNPQTDFQAALRVLRDNRTIQPDK